ncbi:MAG: hypothetical protein AB8D78_03425 [Akkermansiaceae bacterium]
MKNFLISGLLIHAILALAVGQEVPPAFEEPPKNSVDSPIESYDPFDPIAEAPFLVRTQVEYIELSHKTLTRLLLEDESETANAKALRIKVQNLVDKDEAKIIDTQLVVGRNGEKQESDSRQEFIYPTEYEPPALPGTFGPNEEDEDAEVYSVFPFNPGTPTAFETRNLGSHLETEPTVGSDEDRNIIDLRLESELLWHTGNTIWKETEDENGNLSKVAMPNIYTLSTLASITCLSGQYTLVSVLSPKSSEGKLNHERKVMVFVKCRVLPVVP